MPLCLWWPPATHEENKQSRRILLREVGLVIDLRSDSERNETKAQAWMEQAGFVAQNNKYVPAYFQDQGDELLQPTVLRLDLLNPARFMQYLEDEWLSPAEKVQAAIWKMVDGDALHRLRMRTLNSRGLLGLNQAILATGQRDLFVALEAMTVVWESCHACRRKHKRSAIVFNCVQGKDRTGLLSMLCQSILLSDNEGMDHIIVADYHASEKHLQQGSGSAAARDATGGSLESDEDGKLNRNFFSGSPARVMVDTLAWLRTENGSIHGYLDSIGFNATWRSRFLAAAPQQQLSCL